MQCAKASRKQITKTTCLFCQRMEIWKNTNKYGARPTQIHSGMSDQAHGRCKTSQTQIQVSVPNQALEIALKTIQKVQAQTKKLLNLWTITQPNNQEQCAMPHSNLTPSCLCGQTPN